MDCLDRTNVVQAAIAEAALNEQLRHAGILAPGQGVASSSVLHRNFRHLWADNGDALAAQYAGTGAMKSDVTRTGERCPNPNPNPEP